MADASPSAAPSGPERLDSWKEIAAYLQRDVKTVQRWEKREGLPVRRQAHTKQGSVYAFRTDIDRWRDFAQRKNRPNARARGLGVAAFALLMASFAAWLGERLSLSRTDAPLPTSVRQVTFGPGTELYPSISADGKWIIFTAKSGSEFDIYLQSLTGDRPINLTDGFGSDTQGALSPDGEMIVFRSERDGGGIFVMRKTGEALARVARFGFNPAWSPDGRHIAFASEGVHLAPQIRQTTSSLYIATLDGHIRRLETHDAVQPAWSPSGRRLAFWSVPTTGSQRDIWTVAAAGGPAKPVTQDVALDWNPVWASDGYLYFLSDRSGTMNVHRLYVDEQSGDPRGSVEPVTLPTSTVNHLTLAPNATRLAWSSTVRHSNIHRVRFDTSRRLPAGPPEPVTRGSRRFGSPEISADGQWLVVRELPSESLFVARADGSLLRQLPLPAGRHRDPRWTPDGRIGFFSDMSGGWRVWTVGRDGAQLERVQVVDRDLGIPVWSPDGRQLAVSDIVDDSLWYLVTFDANGGSHTASRRAPRPFRPEDWSSDGRLLVGRIVPLSGDRETGPGVMVHDLAASTYRVLTDAGTWWPRWLQDSRHFVTASRGSLRVVDAAQGSARDVLSLDYDVVSHPVVSRHGDWVYFAREHETGDIWTASVERGAATRSR